MKSTLRTFTCLLAMLLLAGGLFAQKGTVSGKMTDETGQAVIGGTVRCVELGTGTISDIDGNYSLQVPAGTYTFQFDYLGYAPDIQTITVASGATNTVDISLGEDAVGINEVVIMGRRKDRLVVDSPVPIDVINAEEIQATGATQTVEVLQMLVPSYSAPKQSISDGSDHFRIATLRGLGPDQVLVLVNGKRRHTNALVHVNGTVGRGSTGVDMNAIPASSVERIEVLRDGAAAQYGSDAIAGVINVVLKKDTDLNIGLNVGTHVTTMERGYDADEGLFDGLTNQDIRDANGSILDPSTGDYITNWTEEVENVNITDGQRIDVNASKGFAVGDGGVVNVSLQYRKQNPTDRDGWDNRRQYLYTDTLGTLDSREAEIDRLHHRWGDADFQDISGFLNAEIPVGNVTAYAFAGLSQRQGESGCFYRRSLDNRTTRALYPDGFLPLIAPTLTDFSGTLGVKGQLSGWNWDLSQVIGGNRFRLDMKNTHNTSLGDIGQYTFPDGVEQKTEMYDGTLVFNQRITNLDISRGIDVGAFASPLNFAVGAEFRSENYQMEQGEITSYYDGNDISGGIQDGPNVGQGASAGCQCFPGWKTAVDQSRNNFGLYADVETDFTEAFTLGVAGRFENYSDFGATVTGKVAARYEIAEGFAIRAAGSTGFRAPSLAQGNYTAIQTTTFGTELVETGVFPFRDDGEGNVAEALGAQALEAEKSVNLSGGLTYNSGQFALTVDAYNIAVRDRIILSEQFRGDALADYLLTQGIRAGAATYFTNALNTSTTGLDIILRYGLPINDNSRVRFILSGNFNQTKVTNVEENADGSRFLPTPERIAAFTDIPLFGDMQITRLEKGTPNNVFNLMIDYKVGGFNAILKNVRFGNITWAEFNDLGNLVTQEFTSKIRTDLELAYEVTDGLRISLGANNLLDVYPDKARKDIAFGGIFQYDGTFPLGYNGRYIYARVNYKLAGK